MPKVLFCASGMSVVGETLSQLGVSCLERGWNILPCWWILPCARIWLRGASASQLRLLTSVLLSRVTTRAFITQLYEQWRFITLHLNLVQPFLRKQCSKVGLQEFAKFCESFPGRVCASSSQEKMQVQTPPLLSSSFCCEEKYCSLGKISGKI